MASSVAVADIHPGASLTPWSLLRIGGEAVVAAVRAWFDDNAMRLGASIAYASIFAIAPLLVIVLAIVASVFGEQAARGYLAAELSTLLGSQTANALQSMLAAAWEHKASGWWASLIGIGTLLIGATGVFCELNNALNVVLRTAPQRVSWWTRPLRKRAAAFGIVLGVGFLALTSLLVSTALAALGKWFNAWPSVNGLMQIVDVMVSIFILVGAFALLLRGLPDRPPPRRVVWIGAIASAVMFTVGKYLIGLYLGRTGTTSWFGAAGSFVAVILWIYYSALLLLLGAEFGRCADELLTREATATGKNATAPESSLRTVRT